MWTLAKAKTDFDNFLGPKFTPFLDVKFKVSKKEDKKDLQLVQNLPMRGRFQAVHAIEESAVLCSRELSQTRKLVSSADTNKIQRHG